MILRSRINSELTDFSYYGCYDWIDSRGVQIITMAINASTEYYRVVPTGKKYWEDGIDCREWSELLKAIKDVRNGLQQTS